MLPPDTVLNGRYRLLSPLGDGGMATVYRAMDTRLSREVAIKILHPEYVRDQPFVERFQREAEFAASLGAHPNIVAIYDVGEDGNRRYIVMELVEGRNLKELIRERAPFSVAEAFSFGRQVAWALDFAHKRGLVHRDIKPQNILVTPEGTAKVTDFGIAHGTTASQLTRTGMVIGTAHYFSPEQAQGKQAAPSSDIYALGIVLYEMLTGHVPFEADNAIGVAMQHLHSSPPSPWDYNEGLPARAVGIVMRALEKDPARRYRDAGEFAAALGPLAAPDIGDTTTVSPVVTAAREPTRIFRTAEPPPRRVVTTRDTRVAAPAEQILPAPNTSLRTLALILGALVVVAAIAGAAFFGTSHLLAGAAATATPTPTMTPTATATPPPKKHHATATPTSVPVVVAPVNTPTPHPAPTIAPTNTFVPPTNTAVPPTSTSVPPTDTPVPQLTPTVSFPGPTATDTSIG